MKRILLVYDEETFYTILKNKQEKERESGKRIRWEKYILGLFKDGKNEK